MVELRLHTKNQCPWKWSKSLCGVGKTNLVKQFGPMLLLWTYALCLCQVQAFQLLTNIILSSLYDLPNLWTNTVGLQAIFIQGHQYWWWFQTKC